MNRYNKHNKQFTKIGTKEFNGFYEGHNDIKYLTKDLNGNLYYTCANYNLKINKTELNKLVPKIDTLNYRFISENSNTKYIVEENIYYKLNPNKKKKLYTFNSQCNPLIEQMDSTSYISLCGNLYALNETKNELTPIHHHTIPKNSITSLKNISGNKLLIGTTSGLYILSSLEIKKVKSGDESFLLKSDAVVSINITSDSVLWIGTAGHGVFTTDLKTSNIKSISSIEYPEIKNNIFNSCILFDNKFYIATHKGIVILNKNLLFNKTIINDYSINTLKAINNKIWLATNSGIIIIDTMEKIVKQFNSTNSVLKSNHIFCLFEYDKSSVWVGTENGLYSIDKNNYSIKSLIPEFFKNITNTNYILNIVSDNKNNIWICHTYGTTKYNRITKNSENFPFSSLNKCSISHRITTSAVSFDNKMYLGTLGGGLNIYNNQKNCFEKYTTNNGLSSDMISVISSNNTNKLWIGTYNGLNEFDVKTQKCKIYNVNNGLLSNEISFNGLSIIEDNVFVCSSSGLNIISNFKKNSIEKLKPPIIKHLYLSGEQLPDTINEIHAKSENTKIILQLCYPQLNLGNVVYQFRFKGKDSVYTTLQKGNNQIIFENIKYGTYNLQIRMYDLNTENTSEPILLKINISQPFYKNIYLIILSSICFCCIIFYGIYIQLKTKNKKEFQKLEIEQKILTERERISKDLHDNIGSQLTYIISNLDYIKHNNNLDNIDDVRNYARDTVQQLRNTIWALSYDKVSLGEFSHRVKSYLLEYLSVQKNINFNSEFKGNEEIEVSPTILLNLFRVIQEIAQNIVKHAEASTVTISYEIKSNILKIKIIDNGKGFDVTAKNDNYGLKNIKFRIEEIGGDIKIESQLNKGTIIHITCSIKNEGK